MFFNEAFEGFQIHKNKIQDIYTCTIVHTITLMPLKLLITLPFHNKISVVARFGVQAILTFALDLLITQLNKNLLGIKLVIK